MAREYTYTELDKICNYCGISFKGHSNRKYCSSSCTGKKNDSIRRTNLTKISNLDHFLKEKILLSKKRGKYPVEVSYEDLKSLWDLQKGLCAISKVPMTYQKGQGKVETNVSMDRIDSSLPYILSNVQLVCAQVNYMKNTVTQEKLLYWCREIINGN